MYEFPLENNCIEKIIEKESTPRMSGTFEHVRSSLSIYNKTSKK